LGRRFLPLTIKASLTATNRPTPTVSPGKAGKQSVEEKIWRVLSPGPWQIIGSNPGNRLEFYWGEAELVPYAGSYSGGVGAAQMGSGLALVGVFYPDDADSWMVAGPFSLVGATDCRHDFRALASTAKWLSRLFLWMVFGRYASIDNYNWYGWARKGYSADWVVRDLDLTNVYTLG